MVNLFASKFGTADTLKYATQGVGVALSVKLAIPSFTFPREVSDVITVLYLSSISKAIWVVLSVNTMLLYLSLSSTLSVEVSVSAASIFARERE